MQSCKRRGVEIEMPNQLMVVAAMDESEDENRFDALFSGQIAKD